MESILEDVAKSVNTICLGFTITLTFIACNFPLSVLILRYLYTDAIDETFANIDTKDIVVMQFLLTISTVVDPFIYTVVAICVGDSGGRRKSASGGGSTVVEVVDHALLVGRGGRGRRSRSISV